MCRNQCTNRCPGRNVREATLALKRIIRNLDIRCGECAKILKIDEYDKHIKLCNQPKCCNDGCSTLESAMRNVYPVIFLPYIYIYRLEYAINPERHVQLSA